MGRNSAYYKELENQKKAKLKALMHELPPYMRPFLEDKRNSRQINTVLEYAYDLKTFLRFLTDANPSLRSMELSRIPIEVLEQLNYADINEYQDYLSYNDEGTRHRNDNLSINRKMIALHGFFKYCCVHDILEKDPTLGAAKQSTKRKKDIVHLDSEEVNRLVQAVTVSEVTSSRRQKQFMEKSRYRDTAIIQLMLNTGIRVSECVGLDVDDINFQKRTISIVRKGGKATHLYFGQEVEDALKDYLELERAGGDGEKALFLSNRKSRMCVKSVENVVKKYARQVAPEKNITPHGLRRSFGTALYRQTEDIRLVADVLGHSDINTTARHYAAQSEDHKIAAAKIKLYSAE